MKDKEKRVVSQYIRTTIASTVAIIHLKEKKEDKICLQGSAVRSAVSDVRKMQVLRSLKKRWWKFCTVAGSSLLRQRLPHPDKSLIADYHWLIAASSGQEASSRSQTRKKKNLFGSLGRLNLLFCRAQVSSAKQTRTSQFFVLPFEISQSVSLP